MGILSALFGSASTSIPAYSNSYMGSKRSHTRTRKAKRKRRLAKATMRMNRRKAKTWKK